MPPFIQFVIRRFLVVPVSLFVVTMALYGGVMLTPPDARAELYVPPRLNPNITPEQYQNMIDSIIAEHHLDAPFPVQYGYWLKSLLTSDWGWSPTLKEAVLPALVRRTPITLELAFYSLLFLIPLGLLSGVRAGWRPNNRFDKFFRGLAFLGTSTPTFILALVLLSVFYVNLHWFSPERIGLQFGLQISHEGFTQYTGVITIDALLNRRMDIFWDAWRHLAMPVVTLGLYHWATLGRVARATVMGERNKEYVLAARARGVNERNLTWRHVYRNVVSPSLTSIALSAASIVTGVFVIEFIYTFNGVSSIIAKAMQGTPDAPAALGFAVYSVIIVLLLMFILDVLQAVFDPRVREGVLRS